MTPKVQTLRETFKPIRSREGYLAVIASLNVEHSPKYQRRDVTDDGQPETFCNFFLTDATHLLGCRVPQLLAFAQIEWLDSQEARDKGWAECSEAKAAHAIELGCPTVAGWTNPSGGHSHVAMVVPRKEGHFHGLHIAQAGRHNFSNKPWPRGFGVYMPRLWTHP